MAKRTRLQNTVLNFTSSIGGQLITVLTNFAVRTVFIHTLGKSYLGIGGLFKNILSMLSLAEMGIGSAIVFKLYEPIASGDKHRVAVLMKFYKTVYRFIGLAIMVIGILLIPFLPYLIKDYDKLGELNINAVLIFGLYLFDSVASYLFWAYKSALIKANQQEYYINIIGYVFTILASAVQIVSLLIFKNFIIYVVILSLKTIAQNLVVARKADKMFPYISKPPKEKIDSSESKGIFKDCGALFIYKLNNVVVKSTDNIVLSTFIGLDAVALYANYYIFYTTITSFFNKVYNSVGHSIGNLHTVHDPKREYRVFETTMLISAVLGGTVFTCIFAVSNEFINSWIGEEWIIPQPFALLMGLEIYTSSFKYAIAKYRNVYGLFRQGWMRPLLSMIINLVLSLILVNPLGIVGVLIGTLAADWLTFVWYDPLVVHRYGFGGEFPISRYFLKFAKYTVTVGAVGVLDYYFCTNFLTGMKWFSVIIHGLICGISTPAAILLVSLHTPESKYVLDLLSKPFRKIRRKKKVKKEDKE